MKIVFMGANQTGWLCLKELLDLGQEVTGIFTIPRQFSISYSSTPVTIARHCSFEDLAERAKAPLVYVQGRMSRYTEQLRAMRPDIVLVSGWYYQIPEAMLKIPPKGTIGMHPSLLPKYRGGAPLTWAILNGEKETGMTFFYFGKKVDSGDIVAQARVAIQDKDTIATLYEKINQATLDLLRQALPQLEAGTVPRLPQDETQATYFPQRSPQDGLIDWARPTRVLYNWIRGQTAPYPGAFTYFGGEKVIVWASRIPQDFSPAPLAQPGEILRVLPGDGIEVATGQGALIVQSVGSGGKDWGADEWIRQRSLPASPALGRFESHNLIPSPY